MESEPRRNLQTPKWTAAILAVLIMALGAGLLAGSKKHQKLGKPGVKLTQPSAGEAVVVHLPERVLSYTSSEVPPTQIELDTLPKDTTFGRRVYTAPDGFQLQMTVVLMGTDRTSIHKPEYCLTSQGWTITQQESTTIPIARPHPYALPVRKFSTAIVAQDTAGKAIPWRGLYVFWFVCENRLTSSHFSRIGWITRELLLHGTLPRWAYASCLVTFPPGKEDLAYQRLEEFLSASVPEFQITTLPPGLAEIAPAAPDSGIAYLNNVRSDESLGAVAP